MSQNGCIYVGYTGTCRETERERERGKEDGCGGGLGNGMHLLM